MSQIPLIGPPLEIRFSVKTWKAYIFTSECENSSQTLRIHSLQWIQTISTGGTIRQTQFRLEGDFKRQQVKHKEVEKTQVTWHHNVLNCVKNPLDCQTHAVLSELWSEMYGQPSVRHFSYLIKNLWMGKNLILQLHSLSFGPYPAYFDYSFAQWEEVETH